MRYCQPYTIHPSTIYSCPNRNCIASTELHWALREQQARAMQQGKAKLNYTPFQETKALCGDNDEASDLALEPELITKPKIKRVQQALPAPAVEGYPPIRPEAAQLRPEWLSCKEWQKVRALQSRGKNILEMAHAVNKNASKLRIYVDTYLKDTGPSPLASANSADSTNSSYTSNSTSGSTSSEGGLFPLDHQVTVPQEGKPDPSFLNYDEQILVWKMFQQNHTVRNMAKRLNKNRQKVSQYINAYMRPKLLKLQTEEQAVEDAATPTPITPLTGGMVRYPPSNPVDPITAATLLTGGIIPQLPGAITCSSRLTPETVTPITAAPGTTSSQEPSLHDKEDADLHAYVDGLLFNSPSPFLENEIHEANGEVALLETKSASDEDSLFGDSPVDQNDVGSSQIQLVSTHHEIGPAQPTPTPRKRKFEDNSPRRASKRLRNRSFP